MYRMAVMQEHLPATILAIHGGHRLSGLDSWVRWCRVKALGSITAMNGRGSGPWLRLVHQFDFQAVQ